MKKFLHVGCGLQSKESATVLSVFKTDEWTEIRFDINESVSPDYCTNVLYNRDTITYASNSQEFISEKLVIVRF